MSFNDRRLTKMSLIVDNRYPDNHQSTEVVKEMENQIRWSYGWMEDYIKGDPYCDQVVCSLFDNQAEFREIYCSGRRGNRLNTPIDLEHLDLVEPNPCDLNELLSDYQNNHYVGGVNYRWLTVIANHYTQDWVEALYVNQPMVDPSVGGEITDLGNSYRIRVNNTDTVCCEWGFGHQINRDVSLVAPKDKLRPTLKITGLMSTSIAELNFRQHIDNC